MGRLTISVLGAGARHAGEPNRYLDVNANGTEPRVGQKP